jgi:hypothetical protein
MPSPPSWFSSQKLIQRPSGSFVSTAGGKPSTGACSVMPMATVCVPPLKWNVLVTASKLRPQSTVNSLTSVAAPAVPASYGA